jgi:hypothetical protein
MAANKVLIDGVQPTVTTVESLYTAPLSSAGVRVVAFTATNNGGTTETYNAFIVPQGGSPDNTNKVVNAKSLAAAAVDTPAAALNHLIPNGGSLQVQVSTGTTIAFRATGIEF